MPEVWREKEWAQDPKFVYHDGNPSYGAVRTDLHVWWPLLQKGRDGPGSGVQGLSALGISHASPVIRVLGEHLIRSNE